MEERHNHIVTAYDEDLAKLTDLISRMGGRAEGILGQALEALQKRDSALAEKVIADDAEVDEMETEIEEGAVKLIALRQPMAVDLREAVAAIKVSHVLERIADYAVNVAKRSRVLNQYAPIDSTRSVIRMGRLAQQLIKSTLDAYIGRDADKALEVWRADREIDDLYDSLFRELLTHMAEDHGRITSCAHLMFIAKNIERIGDHATNIAEITYFVVHGEQIKEDRPKGAPTIYNVDGGEPRA